MKRVLPKSADFKGDGMIVGLACQTDAPALFFFNITLSLHPLGNNVPWLPLQLPAAHSGTV